MNRPLLEIDHLRLAVTSEATTTARALTMKRLRGSTIPLRQIAADVTDAVESRIQHLFAVADLGRVAYDC